MTLEIQNLYMETFKLYATYYHSMGMNVAPIYGKEGDITSYKKPGIEGWQKWHTQKQSIEEVLSFDWSSATGIGLITGFNGYRAIDIDGVRDDLLINFYKYVFIDIILEQLGLPSNYEWYVLSGSGHGCHIIFKIDDISNMEIENYAFDSGRIHKGPFICSCDAFMRMELSWNFFLVLPPSCHPSDPSNQSYFFGNQNKLPVKIPNSVPDVNLAEMLFKWCGNERMYNYRFNDNDYTLYCKDLIPMFGSDQSQKVFCYNDCKGLYTLCDEGKNFLAVEQCQLSLLKELKCNDARINTATLMAAGVFESSNLEVCILLKELLKEKIISSYGYNELKELALQNYGQPCKLMFFDVETNGMPPRNATRLSDQPRIVQISWIVADEDSNILKQCGYIIKPTDFDISDDSIKIHEISREKAMKEGVDIKDVLNLFINDISSCTAIIGHNISFDLLVLRGELERNKIENHINILPTYCTMKLSVDYCKIPMKTNGSNLTRNLLSYSYKMQYNYKYPKLIELYRFLFSAGFDNAHNANSDVKATLKCFFELVKRRVIKYVPSKRTYNDIVISSNNLRMP